MMCMQAFQQWRHAHDMAALRFESDAPQKWIWWNLERLSWTGLVGGIALFCVAIAIYRIGLRLDESATRSAASPPEPSPVQPGTFHN